MINAFYWFGKFLITSRSKEFLCWNFINYHFAWSYPSCTKKAFFLRWFLNQDKKNQFMAKWVSLIFIVSRMLHMKWFARLWPFFCVNERAQLHVVTHLLIIPNIAFSNFSYKFDEKWFLFCLICTPTKYATIMYILAGLSTNALRFNVFASRMFGDVCSICVSSYIEISTFQ